MWALQLLHGWYVLHDRYPLALGIPPVWIRGPATAHPGPALLVLVVAVVALIVGTRMRQGRARRLRHAPGRAPAESVDTSWFAAHTLDGFPEDAVRARLRTPGAPPVDRAYAAWILATHGADAVWLERNLTLPADVARLIVEAAEARRRAQDSPDGHDR
ncbi:MULTISPECIES: hypothetical protein [Streptomyces]|uniref:hypothetical protein n=1 Tax=Streptomyces TaxID=1883 RepID=UPI0013683E08|nr:hypothetical protein [Streptomyces sp. SID2888]MYV45212.1 hypothetical protein [Streptomyces sp. SID2888]